MDEPTILPDGHEIELCVVNDDGMTEDERRRLHASIHRERAAEVCAELAGAGLRSRLDAEDGTLSRRIAVAHHDGVPFVAIVGDREVSSATLSIRARDGRWTAPAREAIAELVRRAAATTR